MKAEKGEMREECFCTRSSFFLQPLALFLSLQPALLRGGICPIFPGLAYHCESSGRMERCRRKKEGERMKGKQLLPLNWCSSYRDIIQDMFSDSAIKELLGNNYILCFMCVCDYAYLNCRHMFYLNMNLFIVSVYRNLFQLEEKEALDEIICAATKKL